MRSSVNNNSNNNEGTIIIHGKIIIHDRNRVQSEVLPIYFNHASFASLRRQLSYFSFVRVGKNRHQSHVMYTNDAVVDLSDILKLKRRTTTTTTTTTTTASTAPVTAATSPRAAIATMTTTLVEDYHHGQVIADSRLTGRSNSKTSVKDSQQKVRLHSLDLRDVLRQQQQQQHLHHSNVSSAADVASAVLSGTLHAAKSNDNLDTTTAARSSTSGGGERVIRPMRAPVLPLCHRRSTPLTTSYADSSMSHSSDNEVEEGGEEDISNNKSSSITGSNDDDEEGLQQHNHAANITNNNNSNNIKQRHHHHEQQQQQQQQQQQSSSSTTVKPNDIITRKARTKLDRLLSVNNIVPFIHLPSSHYSAANKILSRCNKRRKMTKKEVATTEECGYCVNIEGNHDKEGTAESDAAINALLALGSHSL